MAAGRLEILAVGSLDRDLKTAADHYLALLRPFFDVKVREVREVSLRGRAPAEVLRDEGRRLQASWPPLPLVAALAIGGRAFTSEGFAAWLSAGVERGGVAFVIGGSLGLPGDALERSHELVSLSPLTLPHQLARVVLLEQLFRAAKISRGETYHH